MVNIAMTSEISKCSLAEEKEYVEPKKTYPLHSAVEYKNLHKIKILLPIKDVNEKNEKGNTVLHIISDQYLDNLATLDLLLSCDDIDVFIKNDEGFNAFHGLAYRGNLQGIIKLLERFPSLSVDVETEKKDTALHIATKMSYIDVIQYLLSEGADVNHTNEKKCTPLHYSANNGHVECTKILLNYGANVDAVDNYGHSALMKSSKWGFVETCEVLLRNGANVNYASHLGVTALSYSCFNDSAETTELLISFGADINYPRPYSAALFECVKMDRVQCANVLLKAGVNVELTDMIRKKACWHARKNGHIAVAKLLKYL